MNNNDNRNETPAITIADIEALRSALGAEAELQGVEIDTSTAAVPSTIMCSSQPWDS